MKMKKLTLLFALLIGCTTISAQQKIERKLWPDGPAESNGLTEVVRPDGGFTHATDPTLTVYLPANNPTGRAIVVCPGGGYTGLAMQHEGHQVAQWLNEQGITAIVLKYRMPNGNYDIPRKDVQRAIEVTREQAGPWKIDPSKVGVMGFSAGGHLASTAATQFTSPKNRPDFAVLIYPVITMDERFTHMGSRNSLLGPSPSPGLVAAFSNEQRVSEATPPVFIAFSDDDKVVDPRNGTMFYQAMKACDRPCELHIYPVGGHGWGWRNNFKYIGEFRNSFARWLSELK